MLAVCVCSVCESFSSPQLYTAEAVNEHHGASVNACRPHNLGEVCGASYASAKEILSQNADVQIAPCASSGRDNFRRAISAHAAYENIEG